MGLKRSVPCSCWGEGGAAKPCIPQRGRGPRAVGHPSVGPRPQGCHLLPEGHDVPLGLFRSIVSLRTGARPSGPANSLRTHAQLCVPGHQADPGQRLLSEISPALPDSWGFGARGGRRALGPGRAWKAGSCWRPESSNGLSAAPSLFSNQAGEHGARLLTSFRLSEGFSKAHVFPVITCLGLRLGQRFPLGADSPECCGRGAGVHRKRSPRCPHAVQARGVNPPPGAS